MHVNFTRVNKIEADYEVFYVNVNGKAELGPLFSFTRALSCIFSTTSAVNTLALFYLRK